MCVVIGTALHLPAISTGQVTESIVLVHGMWWATYILVDLEGLPINQRPKMVTTVVATVIKRPTTSSIIYEVLDDY